MGEGNQRAGGPERPGLPESLLPVKGYELLRRHRARAVRGSVAVAWALFVFVEFALVVPAGSVVADWSLRAWGGSIVAPAIVCLICVGGLSLAAVQLMKRFMRYAFLSEYAIAAGRARRASALRILAYDPYWDELTASFQRFAPLSFIGVTKPASLVQRVELAAAFDKAVARLAAGEQPSLGALFAGAWLWLHFSVSGCVLACVLAVAVTYLVITLQSPKTLVPVFLLLFLLLLAALGASAELYLKRRARVIALCDLILGESNPAWLAGRASRRWTWL